MSIWSGVKLSLIPSTGGYLTLPRSDVFLHNPASTHFRHLRPATYRSKCRVAPLRLTSLPVLNLLPRLGARATRKQRGVGAAASCKRGWCSLLTPFASRCYAPSFMLTWYLKPGCTTVVIRHDSVQWLRDSLAWLDSLVSAPSTSFTNNASPIRARSPGALS